MTPIIELLLCYLAAPLAFVSSVLLLSRATGYLSHIFLRGQSASPRPPSLPCGNRASEAKNNAAEPKGFPIPRSLAQ